MNMNVEYEMRSVVAKHLPGAIEKAMVSYDKFLKQGEHIKPEDFKKYHEACKVALAHVALLIKMACWAGENAEEGEDVDLQNLIESAQNELNKHNKYSFNTESD